MRDGGKGTHSVTLSTHGLHTRPYGRRGATVLKQALVPKRAGPEACIRETNGHAGCVKRMTRVRKIGEIMSLNRGGKLDDNRWYENSRVMSMRCSVDVIFDEYA